MNDDQKKLIIKRFLSWIEDEQIVNNLTPILEASENIDRFIEYDNED